MLTAMYLLTRRAFAVGFEWLRLIQLSVVMGGIAVAGDVLLPTHGAVGFLPRGGFLAIPAVLYRPASVTPEELGGLRALVRTSSPPPRRGRG